MKKIVVYVALQSLSILGCQQSADAASKMGATQGAPAAIIKTFKEMPETASMWNKDQLVSEIAKHLDTLMADQNTVNLVLERLLNYSVVYDSSKYKSVTNESAIELLNVVLDPTQAKQTKKSPDQSALEKATSKVAGYYDMNLEFQQFDSIISFLLKHIKSQMCIDRLIFPEMKGGEYTLSDNVYRYTRSAALMSKLFNLPIRPSENVIKELFKRTNEPEIIRLILSPKNPYPIEMELVKEKRKEFEGQSTFYPTMIIPILDAYLNGAVATTPETYFKPSTRKSQADRLAVRLNQLRNARKTQPQISEPSENDIFVDDKYSYSPVKEWRHEVAKERKKEITDKAGFWPVPIKFDSADFLDFSRISTLHHQGYMGAGVNILVEEVDGVSSVPVLNCKNCALSSNRRNDVKHGIAVTGIVRRIASDANLYGGPIGSGALRFNDNGRVKDYDIVNRSYGYAATIWGAKKQETFETEQSKTKTLFIYAAGNDNGDKISDAADNREISRTLQQMKRDNVSSRDMFKNIMWVSNMTSLGVISKSSTIAGELLQEHTITALGTDVEVAGLASYDTNGSLHFPRETGTSLAAPIVSGVAALIKGAFKEFSPFDIKTCLLESADTHVFENYGKSGTSLAAEKTRYERNIYSYNNSYTTVVDREEPDSFGRIRLDPKKYGRGILNAPNAMLYGIVLNEFRQTEPGIEADDDRVKVAYHQKVAEEEQNAASRIQSALKNSPGWKRAEKRKYSPDRESQRKEDRARALSKDADSDRVRASNDQFMANSRKSFLTTINPFLVEKILDPYNARAIRFNDDQNLDYFQGHQNRQLIWQFTSSINEILCDPTHLSLNRHAKRAEKKTIMQAVMANVIVSPDQPNWFDQRFSYDPAAERHFNVLRLTEKLAKQRVHDLLRRKTVNASPTVNSPAANHAADNGAADYQELNDISGVDQKTFDTWFDETCKQHAAGIEDLLKYRGS